MSLLRQKSDLKSLKYGDFQTKDPLVTKDINNPPSNNTFSMEINHRIDDTVRIVKLIATKPGISFVAKQAALEVVKQRILSDGKEKLLQQLAAAGLNTVKILGSTIAQIPVNGTGTHFIRGFAGRQGYIERSGAPLAKEGANIFDAGVESSLKLPDGTKVSDIALATPKTADDFIYSRNETPVIQAQDSDDDGLVELDDVNSLVNNTVPKVLGLHTVLQYPSDIRKENRVGLGDQGTRKNRISYTDTRETGLVDNLNALNPSAQNISGLDAQGSRDLIKFRFHLITPTEGTVTKQTNLYFRAFLDSFDDNFSSNWNAHNYIGRGENFYTYGGFDRNISLSFKIAAATRQEMFPLYRKMVMLASATAPTYGDGNFMKGTIVGVTVGDYLHRQYGVLNSVNYSWRTEYPWEIAMQNPEGDTDDDQQELPMVMDCSVQFTPIHNFVPQTGMYHYFTSNDPNNRGKQKVFEEGKMNF